MLTDTNGLLVAAVVHQADIQDRDGAPLVLAAARDLYPWLRHVFADGAYRGAKLDAALALAWLFLASVKLLMRRLGRIQQSKMDRGAASESGSHSDRLQFDAW